MCNSTDKHSRGVERKQTWPWNSASATEYVLRISNLMLNQLPRSFLICLYFKKLYSLFLFLLLLYIYTITYDFYGYKLQRHLSLTSEGWRDKLLSLTKLKPKRTVSKRYISYVARKGLSVGVTTNDTEKRGSRGQENLAQYRSELESRSPGKQIRTSLIFW
jgi:hypothetical protein